ncbi:MAG: hypothetical protein RL235_867 [Chlamydiota bacterium]
MTSVRFSTPVVYDAPATCAQKALTVAEKYLDLGGKPRVTIFAPDADHPAYWAQQSDQTHRHSWITIAIKIASYCTLILPLIALIAKVVLRSSLRISSVEILLNPPTQEGWQRDMDAVIALMTTPPEQRPEGAHECMNNLMRRLMPASAEVDALIEVHADIARRFAAAEPPVSSDEISSFCRYLAEGPLSNFRPWIGYRILEQYAQASDAYLSDVLTVMENYVWAKANSLIQRPTYFSFIGLPGNQKAVNQTVIIEPIDWFGFTDSSFSLWKDFEPDNPELAPIPGIICRMLFNRIRDIHDSLGCPLTVHIKASAEAEMPMNFTAPLVEAITHQGIFCDYNRVEEGKIRNTYYARPFYQLSDEEFAPYARQVSQRDLRRELRENWAMR